MQDSPFASAAMSQLAQAEYKQSDSIKAAVSIDKITSRGCAALGVPLVGSVSIIEGGNASPMTSCHR
jgi:hypothetical protein